MPEIAIWIWILIAPVAGFFILSATQG